MEAFAREKIDEFNVNSSSLIKVNKRDIGTKAFSLVNKKHYCLNIILIFFSQNQFLFNGLLPSFSLLSFKIFVLRTNIFRHHISPHTLLSVYKQRKDLRRSDRMRPPGDPKRAGPDEQCRWGPKLRPGRTSSHWRCRLCCFWKRRKRATMHKPDLEYRIVLKLQNWNFFGWTIGSYLLMTAPSNPPSDTKWSATESAKRGLPLWAASATNAARSA